MKTPANISAASRVRRAGGQRVGPDSAFSLIELMVVIAIIGILAGMLLPVLSKAMERAKRIYCVNNMRQIGIAARVFAGDNADRLPVSGGDSTNAIWANGRYLHYGRLLRGELDNTPRIFYCPSSDFYQSDGTNGIDNVGRSNRVALSSYYFRGSKQRAPGRTVHGSNRVLLSDYETRYPVGWGDWLNRNHKFGKNVLRVDGSVSYVKGEEDSRWVNHGGDSAPGAKDGTWHKLDTAR